MAGLILPNNGQKGQNHENANCSANEEVDEIICKRAIPGRAPGNVQL
jgi:hypothetical protein